MKTCTRCERFHDAASWLALPFVGLQDDGDGGFLVLRNCPCDGTISVELAAERLPSPAAAPSFARETVRPGSRRAA